MRFIICFVVTIYKKKKKKKKREREKTPFETLFL